jgi:hypothetical protein
MEALCNKISRGSFLNRRAMAKAMRALERHGVGEVEPRTAAERRAVYLYEWLHRCYYMEA